MKPVNFRDSLYFVSCLSGNDFFLVSNEVQEEQSIVKNHSQ